MLGSPFYIFMLRQFFLTLPMELEEAALIDGASRLRVWWTIILPLSKPAIATVAIFSLHVRLERLHRPPDLSQRPG